MKYFKDKIIKNIVNDVEINLPKINNEDFELSEVYFNYKCHINAVQSVLLKESSKVFLCIAIDKSDKDPIVHFINKRENGKYIDNTWGWTNKFYDYHIIREVKSNEFDSIGEILENTKKAYIKRNSDCITRFLGHIKYKEI